MSSIEPLLARLQKVKRTGRDQWMARCPSHSDGTASLSLRELPGDRILLHCFAECDVGEILDAIGLTVNDLFLNRMPDAKSETRPFPATDVLRAIAMEAQVVALAAADIVGGVVLDAKTKDRVFLATQRINAGLNAAGIKHG
jgi:hypothetical protein